MMFRSTLLTVAGIMSLGNANVTIAKDLPSPVSLLLKEQNTASSLQTNSTRNERNIDQLDIDLKTDKVRCDDIEKMLTENYGPATSRRHNLRIWEIPNTGKVHGQSKMVTIMAGEENGRYFVKLDRRGPMRGNNPDLNKIESSKTRFPTSQNRSLTRQKTRSYEQD